MIIRILKMIIFLLLSPSLYGQQLPYISILGDASEFWNPASYAGRKVTNIDFFTRQQWIGFNKSPLNGFLKISTENDDRNFGLSGFLHFDRTGPISKIGISGNFAYNIKDLLGEESNLSTGISLGLNNYSLDLVNLNAFTKADPLLKSASSGFFPTIGVGMHYSSSSQFTDYQTYKVGISYNQLTENNIILNGINQKRIAHWFAHFSTNIPVSNQSIEPALIFNYTVPELSHSIANINFYFQNKFWFGLGYSTVNDLNIQSGIQLENFNEYEANLKIGVLANSGLFSDLQNFTPGLELFIRYQLINK
jgi:type IX secretion system PorP/SprF family membrane protein